MTHTHTYTHTDSLTRTHTHLACQARYSEDEPVFWGAWNSMYESNLTRDISQGGVDSLAGVCGGGDDVV